MLECRGCLSRCLRAIAAEASSGPRPYLQNRIAPHARSSSVLRSYSTQSRRTPGPQEFESQSNNDNEQPLDGPEHSGNTLINGTPQKLYDPAKTWINKNRGRRIGVGKATDDDARMPNMSLAMEKSIKRELQYLRDPLKLADHVRRTLKQGDVQKALGLCRLASKDMECVVSWNHVIGYLLSQKQVSTALKLYNEMKKRAQFPDSHTYVVLLRGLSEPPVAPDTVGKALAIYHSLGASNSRVRATTIHTNAALRVCARAYDMDSLWGVASRIPEKGAGAADPHTYTTILNAIREHALLESGDRKDDSEIATLRATATQQGRRIWGDIVGKWRTGEIMVNEEMVGAMGRLLLSGLGAKDWDDVLSLIEQTMEIPRLTPKLGSKMRRAEHLPLYAFNAMKRDLKTDKEDESPESEFDRELLLDNRGRGSVVFVKPGNNTLSLVLEACQKMYASKTAHEYWDLLTDAKTYGLRPDMDNIHMYLRILRQTRSSARTLDTVQKTFPAFGLTPVRKTWRIAMSTCSRDKKNPNAMDHGDELVNLMEHYKAEPDPKTLLQYVELAISTQKGDVIGQAINRLTDHIARLKSVVSFGKFESGKTSAVDKQDVLMLMRTIVGAIDQMINKELIPKENATVWVQRRSKLNAFITRLMDRLDNKNVVPKEKLVELRRDSRQLRHLRKNLVEKQKKANGTWVEDKKDIKLQSFKDLPFES